MYTKEKYNCQRTIKETFKILLNKDNWSASRSNGVSHLWLYIINVKISNNIMYLKKFCVGIGHNVLIGEH